MERGIADADFQRGFEHYTKGEYDAAKAVWLQGVDKGSVDAQFGLGVFYLEGKAIEPDKEQATLWFTQAAQKGHAQAQYNLGLLLVEDHEDIAKVRQGVIWWKKAAENGSIPAQLNYGRALFYGIAVTQNVSRSHYWLTRAAKNGEQAAAVFLKEHNEVFAQTLAQSDEATMAAGQTSNPVELGGEIPVTPEENESAQVIVNTLGDEKMQQAGQHRIDAQTEVEQASTINIKDYVLVKNGGALYTQGSSASPVTDQIKANMLLRVVELNGDWLSVQVPGGVRGWIAGDSGKLVNRFFETSENFTFVFAEPQLGAQYNRNQEKDNQAAAAFSKLPYGSKLLAIEQRERWYKILVPESVPVWIEKSRVQRVIAPLAQIGEVWQNQRLKRKSAVVAEQSVSQPNMDNGEEAVSESIVMIKKKVTDLLETGFNKLIPTLDERSPSSDSTDDSPQVSIISGEINRDKITDQPNEKTPQPPELQPQIDQEPLPLVSNPYAEGPFSYGSFDAQIPSSDDNENGEDTLAVAQLEQVSASPITEPLHIEPPIALMNESQNASTTMGMAVEEEKEGEDRDLQNVLAASAQRGDQFSSAARLSKQFYRVASDRSPIRDAPYETSIPIAELQGGGLVDAIEVVGAWAKVRIPGGLPGWVHSDHVILDVDRVVVKDNRVKLWGQPGDGIDNTVLGVVHKGFHSVLISQNGPWIQLLMPEWVSGWIHERYLRMASDGQYDSDEFLDRWQIERAQRNPISGNQ